MYEFECSFTIHQVHDDEKFFHENNYLEITVNSENKKFNSYDEVYDYAMELMKLKLEKK